MRNKFNEMGSYLIQIGLYFTTKDTDDFEQNQIHNNIMSYLLQSYLYLLNYNQNTLIETTTSNKEEETKDIYLTKKEVIGLYYPLLTDYGLSQAIHTKDFPYHKRGSKYFFRKSEIDEWISKDNNSKKNGKTCNKFV